MQELYGGGAEAEERVRNELQANRYDPDTDTLVWTDGQVRAFENWSSGTGRSSSTPQAAARAGSGPR